MELINSSDEWDTDPDNEVANYDYSDAPSWAIPRDWRINGKYGLDKTSTGPFEDYDE